MNWLSFSKEPSQKYLTHNRPTLKIPPKYNTPRKLDQKIAANKIE
jgi:hypothetical protein